MTPDAEIIRKIESGEVINSPAPFTCDVCNREIPQTDGIPDRCVRIERGDFDLEDRANDNIKFDMFICQKCFMEDEDLCRFFNRLKRMVR